jgi:hypothetical protein
MLDAFIEEFDMPVNEEVELVKPDECVYAN